MHTLSRVCDQAQAVRIYPGGQCIIMPAAKTLEQLTAKFQAFLDPETLNSWGELRELRTLLQKIDTDIAQQRNIEKKEGLQRVKVQLQESRDALLARLPAETKYGRVCDQAERGVADNLVAYDEGVKGGGKKRGRPED